jgi:phasin family protein
MIGESSGKSKTARGTAVSAPMVQPTSPAPQGGSVEIDSLAAAAASMPAGKAQQATIAPAGAAASAPGAVEAKPVPVKSPSQFKPVRAASTPMPLQPKKVKADIKTAPVPARTPELTPEPPVIPTPQLSPTGAQKESIMDMTSNYTNGIQDAFTEAQGKAKEAFEKGSSMLGGAGEFARGNVEAVVESGKILASGLQEMGASFTAESRTAFETMTADLKELAAAKTPADFLKLQSEMIRKSFDSAVAYSSKNSEAVLKLATEAFAPITGRVSLAVEKARTTAASSI